MSSDPPTKVQILGSETPLIVGQPHNVSCLVETYGKEDIILEWTLDGEELQGIMAFQSDDGNSTALQWMLNYDFMISDENKRIGCAVHVLYIDQTERCSFSTSKVVDVYCE